MSFIAHFYPLSKHKTHFFKNGSVLSLRLGVFARKLLFILISEMPFMNYANGFVTSHIAPH